MSTAPSTSKNLTVTTAYDYLFANVTLSRDDVTVTGNSDCSPQGACHFVDLVAGQLNTLAFNTTFDGDFPPNNLSQSFDVTRGQARYVPNLS